MHSLFASRLLAVRGMVSLSGCTFGIWICIAEKCGIGEEREDCVG